MNKFSLHCVTLMWANYDNCNYHVCGYSKIMHVNSRDIKYLDACLSHAGTPSGVDYREVRESLLSIKGVKAVHNLHIWALTMNQAVLSAHVAIGEKLLL